MPRADDVPAFDVDLHEVPTKVNPLGAKGVGEAGTVGALPALVNAVNDALAPLGVRHLHMPVTPERARRAIQEAKALAEPPPRGVAVGYWRWPTARRETGVSPASTRVAETRAGPERWPLAGIGRWDVPTVRAEHPTTSPAAWFAHVVARTRECHHAARRRRAGGACVSARRAGIATLRDPGPSATLSPLWNR